MTDLRLTAAQHGVRLRIDADGILDRRSVPDLDATFDAIVTRGLEVLLRVDGVHWIDRAGARALERLAVKAAADGEDLTIRAAAGARIHDLMRIYDALPVVALSTARC